MNEVPAAAESESRSERITRRLGVLLGRWGVDPLQYHWLLQASLKMDFRSTGPLMGQSREGTKSSLRTTIWMNLIFSGMMSLLFAHMADTFFFTVLLLGYTMLMLAMMILMEFGLAVISPDDHLTLAHRPISSRTFLAVRFSNLMFYVLLLDLSLSAVPAFAGLMCRQSRWFFPPLYLFMSIVAGCFVAGTVIVIYGLLMRWFNYERFKDVLVYCQIAFSLLFFLGYQLVPRLAGDLQGVDTARLTHGWGVLFPSVWFAGLLELGLGHWTRDALLTGSAALAMVGLVVPWLFKGVSLDYSDQVGRMIAGSGKASPGRQPRSGAGMVGWLAKLWANEGEERAFFCFVVGMFRRNRQLKLQLYPNFGIIIAMVALAVLNHDNLSDPFSGKGHPGMAVTFAAMAFVFGAVALVNLLPYSDEYAGGWIFQVAPVSRAETVVRAIRKAAILFLFLPLMMLDVVVFSFFWPILHAFEIGIYGFLLAMIVFQITLFRFRGFPFTKKLEKASQSRQFTMVMVLVSVFGVLVVLPLLVSPSQFVVLVTCAILAAVSLLLGILTDRHFAARSLTAE